MDPNLCQHPAHGAALVPCTCTGQTPKCVPEYDGKGAKGMVHSEQRMLLDVAVEALQ